MILAAFHIVGMTPLDTDGKLSTLSSLAIKFMLFFLISAYLNGMCKG